MPDYRDITDADLAEAIAGLDYNITIYENRTALGEGGAQRLADMKSRLWDLKQELARRARPAAAE